MENKRKLAEMTQLNREKLELEHFEKMKELMDRLQTRGSEIDKEKLDKLSKDKKLAKSTERVEKVKKFREKMTKAKKENMLIKLHQKEQTLKEIEKEKQLKIEIMKEINTFKQKRKDINNENHKKKMELQREEFLEKLKVEQEKVEAYAKQKEMIMEHKHTNQVIDQMKVQYWKEMYYNMQVKNMYGTDEFDKMAKNLKAIPEED